MQSALPEPGQDMVKKRSQGECTFDENGYKKRAACVVFKDEKEEEVLLITSKHYNSEKNWWLIPGGSIEPGESARDAAEREVCEESGVKGQILRSLGQVVNDMKMSRTWVFVMIVSDELQQWDDGKTIGRKRVWFPVEVAKKLLNIHKPVQVKYLELATKGKGHRCDSLAESCNGSCYGLSLDESNALIEGRGASTPSIPNSNHQAALPLT